MLDELFKQWIDVALFIIHVLTAVRSPALLFSDMKPSDYVKLNCDFRAARCQILLC